MISTALRAVLPRLLSPRVMLSVMTAVVLPAIVILWPPKPRTVQFPGGKRFALTIVDDTDLTTLERAKPLYDAMYEAGLRTTKTVWALPKVENPAAADYGDTLQDPDYRAFVMDLKTKGFEIALHGVRGGSSPRATSIQGLDEFKSIVGNDATLFVNHALNQEDLYWGKHRLTFTPYRWALGIGRGSQFAGHVPGSPYFWGDVARQRIKYVRRFVFSEINVLRVNP